MPNQSYSKSFYFYRSGNLHHLSYKNMYLDLDVGITEAIQNVNWPIEKESYSGGE